MRNRSRSRSALDPARTALAWLALVVLVSGCAAAFRIPRDRAPDFVVQRRFERAESLYQAGKTSDAYRLYEGLWNDFEPHAYSASARLRMAEIDLKQHNPEEAEEALADVLGANPTADVANRAQLLYGDALQARGEWPEARARYEAYLSAVPDAPEASAVLARIGEIHERLGEHKLALRAYDRALESARRPGEAERVQQQIQAVLVGGLSLADLQDAASLYRDRYVGVEANRVAAERAATDRAGAERAALQRLAAQRAAAERAAADRAAAQQASQERAVAERAAAARAEDGRAALVPEPPPTPAPPVAERYPEPVTSTLQPLAPAPSSVALERDSGTFEAPAATVAPPPEIPAPFQPEPQPPPSPELTVASEPLLEEGMPDTPNPQIATAIAVEADLLAREQNRHREAVAIVCLLPLTGKYAPYGLRALDGIMEAADVFRPALAGEPIPVRFVIGDTAGDPARALALIDELVEGQNAIAILGPMVGRVAEVVAERASSLGIPTVSLARKAALGGAGQWSFRASLTDDEITRNLVEVAVQEMSIKRFAVLYPNEAYGVEMRDMFVQDVRDFGGEVRAVSAFGPNASDFSAPIKSLLGRRRPASADGKTPADMGFDALFIPGSESNIKLIAPQLAFHDLVGVQLLGTSTWNSARLVDEAGQFLQGAFFLDTFFPASATPEVRTFVDHFRVDFERDPSVIEALAYEAALLLREQVGSGRARTREALARSLATLADHRGVAGLTGFSSTGEAVRKLKALTISGASIEQVRWPVEKPGTTIRDLPRAPASGAGRSR